jgi:3-oxoacyl-[acyl-carrier protein] reductase
MEETRSRSNTRPPADLKSRHALVCGASAGIGQASARALAAHGAKLTLLARRRDALQELAEQIRSDGSEVAILAADLDHRPAVQAALDASSLEPVHILVNNTGGPPPGTLLSAGDDDLLRAFGRHVLAAHMLTTRFLPGMKAASYGRIINVLSTSVREPIPGLGVSNVIRAAMASWAKTLSRELPPNVTINNILPGFTDTERLSQLATEIGGRTGRTEDEVRAGWLAMVPEGRLGRAEELGAAVAFLASPSASYIRGVSLAVDGGRLNSI